MGMDCFFHPTEVWCLCDRREYLRPSSGIRLIVLLLLSDAVSHSLATNQQSKFRQALARDKKHVQSGSNTIRSPIQHSSQLPACHVLGDPNDGLPMAS